MFSKTSYSIFLVGIFLFGFAFLSQPQSAFAGTTGFGCCVNPGGNCNPGCGSEGDACFRDFDQRGTGPCMALKTADCGGEDAPADNKGCHIVDYECFQVTDSEGECRPASGEGCASADECDEPSDPVCFDRVCIGEPTGNCGFVGTGDPSCDPVEPPGPTAIIPTMGQ